MNPINFSDAAHEVGFYVDPTDPHGRQLVGITTAIGASVHKPYLADWRVKLCAEYAAEKRAVLAGMTSEQATAAVKAGGAELADYAANKGTIVHRVMELAAAQQLSDATWDGDCQGHVDAGLAFLSDWAPRVLWTEATVFAPTRGYAGTVDLIAYDATGTLWALDYKTGSKLSNEVGLQLEAVRNADHAVRWVGAALLPGERSNDRGDFVRIPVPVVERIGAVHLKGDGKYVVREVVGDGLFDEFLAAVRMWGFQQRKDVLAPKMAPPAADFEPLQDAHEGTLPPDQTEAGPAPATPPTLPQDVTEAPPAVDAAPDPSAEPPVAAWERLRPRALVIVDMPGGPEALARSWPLGVPTFRECDGFLPDDAARVEACISAVESELRVPFPGANEPPPPVRLPPPAVLAPEPVFVPGDDPRVVNLAEIMGTLPSDLVDGITADLVTARKVPRLTSGQATEEQLEEVAAAITAASFELETRKRTIARGESELRGAGYVQAGTETLTAAFHVAGLYQFNDAHTETLHDFTARAVERFGWLVEGVVIGLAERSEDRLFRLTDSGRMCLEDLGKRPAVARAKVLDPSAGVTKWADLLADVPLALAVAVNPT